MNKKRVTLVFLVLLVFAGALVMLQVNRYGSLMGFVYYDSGDDSVVKDIVSYGRVFAYSRFLIISVVSVLIVEYLFRFHKRINRRKEEPFERRFINLDVNKIQ